MTHIAMLRTPVGIGAVVLALAMICGRAPVARGVDSPATVPSETTRPAQTPVLAENTVLHADVAYGTIDPLQRLDVYAPANAKAAPILLFIHGGEWSRGDKKDVSSKPQFFNNHNIIFISTNYRLSPKYPHPAQADDVAATIGFVHDHAGDFGGDPSKIVIIGHSAGCHLVTLVSLDTTYLAKVHLAPAVIRGTVAWSGGMYDLVARANGGGMYPPFIKATFGESADAQRAGSPLTYAANAATAPPFLFASVDDARSESSRQATAQIVGAITEHGGTADSVLLTGKSHFTANHELGAPGDTSASTLLAFVESVTR